jgi:hypothetical protein
MTRGDADPPIACTLTPDAMPGRRDAWRDVLDRVVARSTLPDGALRLELAPAALDGLSALVAAEHDCCRFFSFAITVDARGAALEVRAPDDAAPVVASLFGGADHP